MTHELLDYLAQRNGPELVRDAVDLLITYYLIYRVTLVLRGTRAIQIGVGLSLLLGLYVVAKHFELSTVFAMLGTVLPSAILIIVVVFQDDIRRGLMRMGSGAWFGSGRFQEVMVIDEVIDAATELARHRIGAIIAFEQDANLDEFVGSHKGIEIDAAVSSQLLVSLFVPEATNALHDGAVIVRNLRIAKAGVFFPFTQSRVIDESFGSRHRAALGITEETDAVLVVVSEERGSISFCFNGNIVSDIDGPRLRAALEGVFSPKAAQRLKSGRLWSRLPTAKRPSTRAPQPNVERSGEASSEAPGSVRIHAAPPPGSVREPRKPVGAKTASAPPLRKSAALRTKSAEESAVSTPVPRSPSAEEPS